MYEAFSKILKGRNNFRDTGVDWRIKKTKLHGFSQQAICGLVVRVPGYRSRGPLFDFRRYPIFLEVVGLERGPLSLVSITEKPLEWKSSGCGSRKPKNNGRGDKLR
jgi:hypothetical protein